MEGSRTMCTETDVSFLSGWLNVLIYSDWKNMISSSTLAGRIGQSVKFNLEMSNSMAGEKGRKQTPELSRKYFLDLLQ